VIIDIYAHHISERVAKYVVKGKYYGEGKEFPFPPQNADPQARLALMDKYGVNIQALSQTTPPARVEPQEQQSCADVQRRQFCCARITRRGS
jgi:hypothetical protein